MKTALLDTSSMTNNLGDHVIVRSLLNQVPELKEVPCAGTHGWPNPHSRSVIKEAEYLVFAGTNVLTPKLYRRKQWPSLTVLQHQLKGKVWYAGVGWGTEANRLDPLTSRLVRRTMAPGSTIGARDTNTQARATASGLSATYIGCPTMWGLQDKLPTWEGVKEVVATLTDYNQCPEADEEMLAKLVSRFEKVYFWPQGSRDLDYAMTLPSAKSVSILPANLSAYDEAIKGRGHIGTRLHGGIRALQHGSPSFVFSVDRRALAIGSDTGLPVTQRGLNVEIQLDHELNDSTSRALRIPRAAAQKWVGSLRASINAT